MDYSEEEPLQVALFKEIALYDDILERLGEDAFAEFCSVVVSEDSTQAHILPHMLDALEKDGYVSALIHHPDDTIYLGFLHKAGVSRSFLAELAGSFIFLPEFSGGAGHTIH